MDSTDPTDISVLGFTSFGSSKRPKHNHPSGPSSSLAAPSAPVTGANAVVQGPENAVKQEGGDVRKHEADREPGYYKRSFVENPWAELERKMGIKGVWVPLGESSGA